MSTQSTVLNRAKDPVAEVAATPETRAEDRSIQSESEETFVLESGEFWELEFAESIGTGREIQPGQEAEKVTPKANLLDGQTRSGYEPEVIEQVWQFARRVEGIDCSLWRQDESGEWIYRLDYGNRHSRFGWEIFDPGIGRHRQGITTMRPLHWQSFLREHQVA
ncbi:MAG: hypothetical protein AAF236_15100 [Verrucomicrobiota bacterium]